jgi:nucleotide-binding universal stress UspA family protein
MARRGKNPVERALIGSVTARVIGTSQRDVLVIPEKAAVGWQKILVATDGSKYSRAATERAIDFARSYGGELKVLSVVDVPAEFYAEAPKAVEDLVEKARGYVREAADQAQKEGVKAEAFVKEGTTYEAVTALAREQGVNVIVVGSHGKTGLKRLLMGSVTEKVIGHASCPVLVIRI